MELYITDLGTVVKKRDDLFEITTSEKKVAVAPQKIKSLVLSKGIFLTTDVIKLAVDNNIDIVIVDNFGNPYGRFWQSKFGSQLILEENSWKYLGLKKELNWQNRY
jgi:CRISPR associated protein cas1